MSMIQLQGVLLHTFKAKNREQEEKDKVQVLGDVGLPNGEIKKDLMTITVANLNKYEGLEGTEVTIPVGAFAPQKGTIIFFEIAR